MFGIDAGVMALLGYLFAGVSISISAVLSYRGRTLKALVIGLAVGTGGWIFLAYVIPAVMNFGQLLSTR